MLNSPGFITSKTGHPMNILKSKYKIGSILIHFVHPISICVKYDLKLYIENLDTNIAVYISDKSCWCNCSK